MQKTGFLRPFSAQTLLGVLFLAVVLPFSAEADALKDTIHEVLPAIPENTFLMKESSPKTIALAVDSGLIAEIWGGKLILPLNSSFSLAGGYKQALDQSNLRRTSVTEYSMWLTYYFDTYHVSGPTVGLFLASLNYDNTTYENNQVYEGKQVYFVPGLTAHYELWTLDWLSFEFGGSLALPTPTKATTVKSANGDVIKREVIGSGTISPSLLANMVLWL